MQLLAVLLGVCSLAQLAVTSSHVIAMEAQVGSSVVLPCPSNDDHHRFQFWQLAGDEVIGPGNLMDKTKYKYDVLTGKLTIKGVSTAESGFYKCVTKQLSGDRLHILAVELVVRKDWEEEYETDHETNVFRILVVVLVMIGLIVVGILLYSFYSGQKTIHRITRLTDDECPDDPPAPRRGTYNSTTVPTSTSKHAGVDHTSVVDTSFPSALKTLESTSSM